MPAFFDLAHAFTAQWEGGLTDHPADPGGITNYGVSLEFLRDLANEPGGLDTLERLGVLLPVRPESVRRLSRAQARALFRMRFWDALRLDGLPGRPALCLYDAAVNCGPAQSVTLAQRGYNDCVGVYGVKLAADGKLGPHSRECLSRNTDRIVACILEQRRIFYRNLARKRPSLEVFMHGWINRVDDLEKYLAKNFPSAL